MTTDPLLAPAAHPLPVPVVLGLQEGRRIVLHPLSLLGWALLAVVTVEDVGDGPRGAFELATAAPTFFTGVFTYFAAHLVASRDRRADSGELLDALVAPPGARLAGLCLAALVPTVLSAAYVLAVDTYCTVAGLYVEAPSLAHLAAGPLSVLGGTLLGTMVARLTFLPASALVVMCAMVTVNAWLNGRDGVQLLGTYVSWPVWEPDGAWHGLVPGSAGWHAGYLASLCAMAAAGTFLRETQPRLPVLYLGGAATAAAVVTGLLQLP